MSHPTRIICLFPALLIACTSKPREGDGGEWVHDPSRPVLEGGEWVIYGSGTEGMALTRSIIDLESGDIIESTGLAADEIGGDWWPEVQEWNPSGEFDAPTLSDDGQMLAFTVFDEEEDQIRDVTGLAIRTDDGFAPAGIILSSMGEAVDTARAMDASFVSTAEGSFLVFGSHAGGIYVTELNPETGLLLDDGAQPDTEASPDRFHAVAQDTTAGIEAPYIHHHQGWYYLFVNKGQCCHGSASTYEVVMGRSQDIHGPYLDRDGASLLEAAGTPLLTTDGRFIGPGHVGIQTIDGVAVIGFHFYDGADQGIAKYALHELHWHDGWPEVGDLRATHRAR